jgi:putative tail fiber protein|nr:MAG TPA: Baseplate structural protein [Bacteriophage sp.]
MALVNKPDESIFASSAKQGEVDNFPDLLRGWGITFEQTQGIPPMEWFNFLFKRLDEKHTYLMQRGLPEWSATQDYTKGSCVQFDGVTYRALKNSKNNSPNESNSQYWVRWGFALSEIARATLTQYGLTQLYTGYNSQREDLALTPKTAFLLKQLIDSNTRALGNVIPNSKKSSAVNSNSNDTVATSAAVKTAYDKGVEAKNAADNAQRTAEDANRNANTRVAKSGDTMTGDLSFKQGDYSGLNLYNNNGYYLRLEGNNHANGTMLTAVYRKPNGENVAVAFLPKRDGTIAYIDQVVNKTGDTMTGNLTVPNLIVNDPTNNNNFVQIGDDAKLIDVDMGHTVGLQATDNANDAYIAYGTTKKRFGFDGANFKADSGIAAQWYQADAKGHGSFGAQWRDKTAPYVINNPNANGSNIYFPFLKGFNSNGDLYGTAFSIGYMTPGAINQFGRGVIHLIEDNGSEKYWWFDRDGKLRGDDFECQGKRLSKSHQTDYAYVETTAAIWGGLKINRNGDHMLIESNDRGGFSFVRRNKDGSNVYVLSAPAKNGTLATLEELPKERLIWQGSTDNQITVNAQIDKGVLFVLMDTPVGANANRPIWFSAPIEQSNDTRIGEYDTGGADGDYNFVTIALLHRNGSNITITPQSDGRKPRLKKVVVFG